MELLASSFQFLFLALFLIPAIFFLLTQQNTLKAIQPHNRTMSPGQVWLQLIPIFGMIWQFFVVSKISDSLRRELAARNTTFSFEEKPNAVVTANLPRPTYSIGIAYCILMWGMIVPLLNGVFALAAIVCWIIYW